MPEKTVRRSIRRPIHRRARRGFSMVELMIVVTILMILVSTAIPSFHRSLEQSRADIAGANLQAIWSAERLYWLEYRTYTTSLTDLQALGLVDPIIVAGTDSYTYAVTAADAASFSATATRTGSTRWSGSFAIAEDGSVSGVVQATGESDISPGFQ